MSLVSARPVPGNLSIRRDEHWIALGKLVALSREHTTIEFRR